MTKRKISITTGTRSEYGLLRPVIKEIAKSKKLEPYLIVTGMHLSKKYGMTINEIKKDGFKIYSKIDMITKGDSPYFMSQALGKGIIGFSRVFKKLKPDINLILGDRDEPLASALAASHMNIPNAHIHGGEKSLGIDEYNRHTLTKISNIHFAVTKQSQKRIIKMGEDPKNVIFTGSPSIDEVVSGNITNKKELEKIYNIKFKGDEILLVQHPITTEFQKSTQQIINTLDAVVRLKKLTIAIAPNSDAGNQAIFKNLKLYSQKNKFIRVYPNVSRCDYLGFIKNCGVLVGNSSSGLIEGGYFNTPVVNIGLRQFGREKGKNVIDVNNDSTNSILHAIQKAMNSKKNFKNNQIYGKGNSSKKIVKFLENVKLENLIHKQISY